jgi:uncharacterized membrane protein
MFALGLLLALFLLFHLPGVRRLPPLASRRDKAAAAMAGLFFFTGTDHFLNSGRYVPMIPPMLPAPLALVYISGLFELLGATGLLVRRYRRWAGLGLAALLVAVFPANIYVAVSGGSIEGTTSNPVYYWVRLLFQPVFIAWAIWVSRPEAEGR